MHRAAAVSELSLGIDYWLAATHAPGVGRYLREWTRALAELEQGPRLALFDVGPAGESIPEEALGLAAAGARVRRRRARIRRGWTALLERGLGLPVEAWIGKVDVFHRAHPLGSPRSRAPAVVALAQPPSAAEREALSSLAAVLVFSEHAREQLVQVHGVREDLVQRVPVGADHWRRGMKEPLDRRRAGGRARILVLGAVRAGRGHGAILESFNALRGGGADLDLVICGRRGDAAPRLESALRSSPFRTDVRWIDEPMESAMAELAAGADVLVHLERASWTAVTPLEAMGFGAAVVTSPLPAFREALGGLAHYVEGDPEAPTGLSGALELALASSADDAARLARRELARGFTWRANALATLKIDSEIAARRG